MAQEQMILPKGIVLNTDSIYAEIAKFDVIPVERILRACHVFTTTSRTLYDPTARRLENFWTRVLGGNRRFLSGKVIAQMFRDISEETSFVKLRGPRNRYEPPSPGGPASKTQDTQNTEATPLALTPKPKGKSTVHSTKAPHPILKKPRGPSASGPRPTARFISPPASGIGKNDGTNEGKSECSKREGKPSGSMGSTTAATTNSSVRDTSSKEEKKKGLTQKPKKTTAFVASTSSRRRPGMPRKSSSQPGATSETGPKEGGPSMGPKNDGSQGSGQKTLEKPEQQTGGTKKGKGSSGGSGAPALSAKAAGKRPAVLPRVEKSVPKPKPFIERITQPDEIPMIRHDQTELERRSPRCRVEIGEDDAGGVEKTAKFPFTTIQHDNTKRHLQADPSPSMNRSASDIGPIHVGSREVSRAPIPPSSLMASTLAKIDTSVVGRATIYGFSESYPNQGTSIAGRPSEHDGRRAHDEALQNASGSGLYQQFTPTPPSNAAIIPLARSKSQLSVLLERKADKKSKR